MEREIKFRAWDGKEMHLPEYSDKEDFHLLPDGTIVETHEHGYERHELTGPRGDNWKVMQFTGLKDKNGKEIYEGDIISNGNIKWEVEYFGGAFWLSCDDDNMDIPFNEVEKWRLLEVIGDIYSNPELLK